MSPLQIIGLFAAAIAFGCLLSGVLIARKASRAPTSEPVEHFERDVP